MHYLLKVGVCVVALQIPFMIGAQNKINHYNQGKKAVESFIQLVIAKAKKDSRSIMRAMHLHSTVIYPKNYNSFQGKRFSKGIKDTMSALSIHNFKKRIEHAHLTKSQKIEACTEYFVLKTLGLQKYAHLFFTQEKPSQTLKNKCRKKALQALKKPKESHYRPVSNDQSCSCSVSDDSCSASSCSCSCSCDDDYEYVVPYYTPFLPPVIIG